MTPGQLSLFNSNRLGPKNAQLKLTSKSLYTMLKRAQFRNPHHSKAIKGKYQFELSGDHCKTSRLQAFQKGSSTSPVHLRGEVQPDRGALFVEADVAPRHVLPQHLRALPLVQVIHVEILPPFHALEKRESTFQNKGVVSESSMQRVRLQGVYYPQ